MKKIKIPKGTVWYEAYKVFLRFLILLGATVLISVLYKGIIETDFFSLIKKLEPRRIVFCGFELLLLGVYWHFLFIFQKICRHNTHSLKVYYIRTLLVFAAFTAVYVLSHLLLSADVNAWIFRLTYNLICFRLKTNAPDNLLPYMIAYLAVTFLIMMLEPFIAKNRYMAWRRTQRWSR